MRRGSPQEKKALSYARDCRYNYGESNKGSRRSIRRNSGSRTGPTGTTTIWRSPPLPVHLIH
ncbi:hypothetical protein [Micromonospora thermarum]|uniref:Uncharacterized protein n=1 Tax=Micromonospora thermarum TaxID=2720024 RepID=A0ABX0ZDS5_9ACTN|nr:hypothetical protein [Micromonospora thermarum]NJP35377.1 hypothetical protein [Micromonospora thermarum]